MKGAWSLRGFMLTHFLGHVRMHTDTLNAHSCRSYWSVGTNLLWAIMLFASRGKSIPLLLLLANTWKGTLLSLNVMLPVHFGCEIGNLCFRLAVIRLSHITLNLSEEKTVEEKWLNICCCFFLPIVDPEIIWLIWFYALPQPECNLIC